MVFVNDDGYRIEHINVNNMTKYTRIRPLFRIAFL